MPPIKWKQKLTKRQLLHITVTNDYCTLKLFKKHYAEQKEKGIKCYECYEIAVRLGIEERADV